MAIVSTGDYATDYIDSKPGVCKFGFVEMVFFAEGVIGSRTQKTIDEQYDMISEQLFKIPGVIETQNPSIVKLDWTIRVRFDKIPDLKQITTINRKIEKAVNRYADKWESREIFTEPLKPKLPLNAKSKPSPVQMWMLEMIERGSSVKFSISAADAGSKPLMRHVSIYKSNGLEGESIPLNTWNALVNRGWVECRGENTNTDLYGWHQTKYYQISELGRKALELAV